MPLTILITGFGRFPGAHSNPSGALALHLARIRRPAFAKIRRVAHVFPTEYAAVDHELPALIEEHHPDAILMFGLAARTRHVRLELHARNTLSAFPDARGFVPAGRAIAKGDAGRRHLRGPHMRLLQALRSRVLAARFSRDAGRYLCNYAYWRAIEASEKPGGPKLVVFVHIPKVRKASRRRTSQPMATLPALLRAGEAMTMAAISALGVPTGPASARFRRP